jgi:hypothetical protein
MRRRRSKFWWYLVLIVCLLAALRGPVNSFVAWAGGVLLLAVGFLLWKLARRL